MNKPAIKDEVPPLAEELERKTVEALQSLLERHDMGQISDDAFQMGLKTVNAVTRGLVDDAISFGVDDYIDQHTKPVTLNCLLYSLREKRTIVLSYKYGEDLFKIIDPKANIAKPVKGKGIDASTSAFQKFIAYKERLLNQGFIES